MTETLLIDCAWSKPTPAAIKAAGYSGVIGYISHDLTKDLTAAQAAAYRKAGLLVGFVFETTASRAKEGEAAGRADAAYAEAQAKQRGYPKGCVIFYAVDFDATARQILPYFRGVKDTASHYGWGAYGSAGVVSAVHDLKPTASWQTVAWSGGVLSPHADVYQRAGKTRPPIKGVVSNSYDEDVLVRHCPLWGAEKPEPAAKANPLTTAHRNAAVALTAALAKRDRPLPAKDVLVMDGLIAAAKHARGVK